MIIFQFGVSFAICSLSLLVSSFIDILIENDIVKNNFKVTKFVVMIGGCVASVIGFIFVLVAYMTLSLSSLIYFYGVLGFIIIISLLVAPIVVYLKLDKMYPTKNHLIENILSKLITIIGFWFLGGIGILQIVIVMIFINLNNVQLIMTSILFSYIGIIFYFTFITFILFPPRYYEKYCCCCFCK